MDSEKKIDELFNKAKNEKPKISFETVKANFKNNLENVDVQNRTSQQRFLTFKKGIIMVSIMSFISLIIVLIVFPEKTEEKNNLNRENINLVSSEYDNDFYFHPIDSVELKPVPEVVKLEKIENIQSSDTLIEEIKLKKSLSQKVLKAIEIVDNRDFVFPKLTEDQRNENSKEKKKMMKSIKKMTKNEYSFIPAADFTLNNKAYNSKAIYMQSTEVTVLQYRTFLFDLIIQNRLDDFMIAKPSQELWTHQKDQYLPYFKSMEEKYFSHKAYNGYPINNVSREGVELYCQWITEELKVYLGDKKSDNLKARIPTEAEWLNAASVGGKMFPYPWGGPNAVNSEKCFLANFWIRDFGWELDSTSACGTARCLNPSTSLGYYFGCGYNTGPVYYFYPNNYFMYNMSGNVAEMAIDSEGSIVYLGGGWRDAVDDVKLLSKKYLPDNLKGDVDLGFRIVFSFLE